MGPEENRRHGGVHGEAGRQKGGGYLGKRGGGTKREDCEAVLDGVGFPAHS